MDWRLKGYGMDTPQLKLRLFGAPLIEVDHVLVEPRRRKAIALLAYLAVTNQHHTRDTLATLLWPEYDQVNARAALRGVLNSLKDVLGDKWLYADRELVALKENHRSWIDVKEFCRLLGECKTHGHEADQTCAKCIGLLTNAVEIYHDDFMAGFTLRNSASFDEWQSFQTEELRQEVASALERLVKALSDEQDFDKAIKYVQRWLAVDAFNELAHRYAMQFYSQSDQRALALRQYELCQIALNELGVEPQASTVELYTAIKEGQFPLPQPKKRKTSEFLRSLKTARTLPAHNLPPKLTPFLGREAERIQVAEILADPDCRLLTLTGLGGIGKTRLALQAAEDQLNFFAQGVFYIALASLPTPELLIQAIANAVRFRPQGSEALKTQLFKFLGEKAILLVLDNFEHLLDEVLVVSELLAVAPSIKILATSREPLALHEEWLIRLEGMPYPASEAAEAIENYDAIKLFNQSARRAQASFSLVREISCVVRICNLLEGMPLGIELAAGNLYNIPCDQIAEQIEQNIDLLATSVRNIPERHRSLRAVFEHSWNFLTEVEQQTLAKLCVFRGGFTLEAAVAVAAATQTTLQSLAEKSLIDMDSAGRYDIHEMLRQFAGEKLAAFGEQDSARLDHLDYFCELAEAAEPRLQRADQLEWLQRLDLENSNLSAALQEALDRQASLMALRLVSALSQFWVIRISVADARRFMSLALAIPGGEVSARAQALNGIGSLARYQGDYQAAQTYYDEALALFRRLEDEQGIANVIARQGIIALKQANFQLAQSLLEEALDLFRVLDDAPGTAFVLNNLGAVAHEGYGDSETALRFYKEALSIRETLGDKQNISLLVSNLGVMAHDMGDFAAARSHYQTSSCAV